MDFEDFLRLVFGAVAALVVAVPALAIFMCMFFAHDVGVYMETTQYHGIKTYHVTMDRRWAGDRTLLISDDLAEATEFYLKMKED